METNSKQKASNIIRIVFYGPESTGKTSLCIQAAKMFNTVWVEEYAREYLQQKWNTEGKICEEKDIIPIAEGQLELENSQLQKANKFLFCDTNILETKIYAEQYYSDYQNEILNNYIHTNHYDFYFLTDIDVPFEEDDLRDRPHLRQEMFDAFKEGLERHQCNYKILSGSIIERMLVVEKTLNNLFSHA